MGAKKNKVRKIRTIDITSFTQVRNIAMSFKVTEQQLKDAVAVVGNVYSDVQKHLGSYNNPYLHRTKGWRM